MRFLGSCTVGGGGGPKSVISNPRLNLGSIGLHLLVSGLKKPFSWLKSLPLLPADSVVDDETDGGLICKERSGKGDVIAVFIIMGFKLENIKITVEI